MSKKLSEVDQVEKVDFIEFIIQEHVNREVIEDPIERALVWTESHDQLESKCISSKDPVIARGGSDSIMHVGHWIHTFEPLAPSAVKPILFKKQPPL